jgi:hypothetical protein
LAATRVAAGLVTSSTEVECDNLQKGIRHVPPKETASTFGLLLGRVLAHEFYHIVAQTVTHQKMGLAKSVLKWDELLSKAPIYASSDVFHLAPDKH